VTDDRALLGLMRAICSVGGEVASQLLKTAPELALAQLATGATRARSEEFFLHDCRAYAYAVIPPSTSLRPRTTPSSPVNSSAAGADVRAKNRRGAEPLHEADNGVPGSMTWDPRRQAATVTYLIEAGADPNAVAAGASPRYIGPSATDVRSSRARSTGRRCRPAPQE
jgi:hypothetical protein